MLQQTIINHVDDNALCDLTSVKKDMCPSALSIGVKIINSLSLKDRIWSWCIYSEFRINVQF